MSEEQLYRIAYNTHERAEAAAMEAMRTSLADADLDALACLCDPQWGWEERGWMSRSIIEHANEALDGKLEALVA